MAQDYLWVIAGAIAGACARFFFTHLSSEISQHHGFPYGTLLVNVAGSLIAGFFLAWTADRALADSKWRLLVVTGFCGSFTTFSAYAFETASYFREMDWRTAGMNMVVNNVLCIVAIVGGAYLASSHAAPR